MKFGHDINVMNPIYKIKEIIGSKFNNQPNGLQITFGDKFSHKAAIYYPKITHKN